jgi:hypothetical protein
MEAGVMADMFFQNIPILVESPSVPELRNKSAFINLFVSLQFGKRS